MKAGHFIALSISVSILLIGCIDLGVNYEVCFQRTGASTGVGLAPGRIYLYDDRKSPYSRTRIKFSQSEIAGIQPGKSVASQSPTFSLATLAVLPDYRNGEDSLFPMPKMVLVPFWLIAVLTFVGLMIRPFCQWRRNRSRHDSEISSDT